MIEITTGVVFLMSSLYGSGHSATQSAAVGDSMNSMSRSAASAATATPARSFTTSEEIEAYLREEYADTPILVDVARCESTFRQYGKDGKILRGKVNKDDIGIMQINEFYHGETASKLGYDLTTVEGNASFAKYLYGKYGTQPWKASAPCWSSAQAVAKK